MDTLKPLYASLLQHTKQVQSCYLQAIHFAKRKEFDVAEKKMKEGSLIFIKGQRVHNDLVKQFTMSNQQVTLMLVHCEDALMATTSLKILAEECIDVYRYIS